jgi:hypothetical protein
VHHLGRKPFSFAETFKVYNKPNSKLKLDHLFEYHSQGYVKISTRETYVNRDMLCGACILEKTAMEEGEEWRGEWGVEGILVSEESDEEHTIYRWG